MAVAIDPHHGFKLFSRSQRCSLQSLTELDNNILSQTKFIHHLKQAFEVASFHRSFSTPCLSLATKVEEQFETNPRIETVGSRGASRVRGLVVEVAIALASGVDPEPVSSGLGGAYFMRSQNGKIIAVAKPVDEEPLAINNPKGFAGLTPGQPGMKPSVRVGETGLRELAAYLLDHGGFAGVPPTALVKISHVVFHVNNANTTAISAVPYKIASLQRYVDHDFDAGELGPSGFSVASVHRIGIFDIRVLNLDRHAGNILIKKQDQQNKYAVGAAELVPIDHGLCLPEWIDDPYFEWLHWPQASVPFSEVEMEYMGNLDPVRDAELLRKEVPSISESSIRVLVICTNFLKRAAAAGLCLADIGEMMSREFCIGEENLSVLENLCAQAKASVVDLASRGEDNNRNGERQEDFEEKEMFQFDEDSANGEVLKLPLLFQSPPKVSKPPKIPKFPMGKSTTELPDAAVNERNNYKDGDNGRKESKDDIDGGDKGKTNGLLRSISLSAENYTCETGGVSFGDMSEDEWEVFLQSFEELLPELFEGSKCMGLKQRLGTSCKF